MTAEQNPGSAIYSGLFIYFYDFWVLLMSNLLAWNCSTTSVQLPLFRSALGRRHLDVGVGTGYYPIHAIGGSSCEEITLVDLNSTALDVSERRIKAAHETVTVRQVVADASSPLPIPPITFDSISVFYLLHCMPGPPERKTRVFDVLRRHLAPQGMLVGSTILGQGVSMNSFAKGLMAAYNKKGVFDNCGDSQKIFEEGLRRNFEHAEVWRVGMVMLFRAQRPRGRASKSQP